MRGMMIMRNPKGGGKGNEISLLSAGVGDALAVIKTRFFVCLELENTS